MPRSPLDVMIDQACGLDNPDERTQDAALVDVARAFNRLADAAIAWRHTMISPTGRCWRSRIEEDLLDAVADVERLDSQLTPRPRPC